MLMGIYFMAGYPFVKQKHFGHILLPQSIYSYKNPDVWNKPEIEIYHNDNPSRFRYTAFFDYDGKRQENGIVLLVKLSNPDGVILDETVKLLPKVDEKDKTGTHIDVVKGALFVVRYPGTYTLDISLKDEAEHSLTNLSVLMYGRVAVRDTSMLIPGFIMLFIGFILSLFRTEEEDDDSNDGDDPTDTETSPKPPKSRKLVWGRDTDSK